MTIATIPNQLFLNAETAQDLMTPNPISVNEDASLKEAIGFLVDKGFSAAPVVDDAGRPVGVLSQTDIVVHDRNRVEYLPSTMDFYAGPDLTIVNSKKVPAGFEVEVVDRTRVRDVMTPAVLSVSPNALALYVISEMLALKVHRLFVVDDEGVLVGVIIALDVLRKLRAH